MKDREISKGAHDQYDHSPGLNAEPRVWRERRRHASVHAYASEQSKLSIGGIDDRGFSNTAAPYLPGDPAADLMYVYKVSRNCG